MKKNQLVYNSANKNFETGSSLRRLYTNYVFNFAADSDRMNNEEMLLYEEWLQSEYPLLIPLVTAEQIAAAQLLIKLMDDYDAVKDDRLALVEYESHQRIIFGCGGDLLQLDGTTVVYNALIAALEHIVKSF